MMLPPLHVRPPAPRALTDFAPPPPRPTPCRTGILFPPVRACARGKPARAVLPRTRRRQGGNPRISGGFARSPPRRPGAPIHKNRLQKNGKYSWNVHCNFSQSSPICSIMNHRHSRGPGAHARRAAAPGARFPDRLSLCSQVPFPIPGFPFAGNARHPPPGRRRADASFVSFVRPLHAERLRPLAPPGVQHHIGKGECL